MAVPTIPGPRNQVGPVRAQLATSGAPARIAADVNEAANAAGDAAEELARAKKQQLTREDSLSTIQALRAAEDAVSDLYIQEQTEGDMTKPENVAALRDRIFGEYDKAVAGYSGQLPESRLILQQEVERAKSKWNLSLKDAGLKAGQAAMDAEADKKINELVGLVGDNPDALPDAQAEWGRFIALHYAPSMDKTQEAVRKQTGLQELATAAVDYHFSSLDFDGGLDRMRAPDIAPYLGATRSRELRLKAYQGKGIALRRQAEAQANLQIIRDAGIDESDPRWTEIVIAATAGVTLPQIPRGPQTLDDKIASFERSMSRATGKPYVVSPQEVRNLAEAAGGDKNPTLYSENWMRGYLTENAEAIRSGVLPQSELERYITVAGMYQGEADPISGARNQLPVTVRDALTSRGIDPHTLTDPTGVGALQRQRQRAGQATGREPAGGVVADLQDDAALQPGALSPEEQAVKDVVARPVQAINETLAIAADEGTAADPVHMAGNLERQGIKFFDVVHHLTGAVTGTETFFTTKEPLGRFSLSDETVTLQQGFATVTGTISYAFREGNRYADAERQDIQGRLKALEGNWLKSPQTMRSQMVGLDDALSEHEAHYTEELAKEGTLSAERARDVTDRLSAIRLARKLLGVPPLVLSEEEFWDAVKKNGLSDGDFVRAKGKLVSVGAVRQALSGGEPAGGEPKQPTGKLRRKNESGLPGLEE